MLLGNMERMPVRRNVLVRRGRRRMTMCPVCKCVGTWATTKLKSEHWTEAHMREGILPFIENGKVVCPGKTGSRE